MADRYWVGGSGNWSDDTNHWATSSGGTPGSGNKPTASDNAHFDANSNTTAYTVTIDAAAVCLDLMFDAAPSVSGTITWAGTANMTISGSMKLLSGMARTYDGPITFNATSTGKTITTNGVNINTSVANPLTFDGVGGAWTLQDALTSNLRSWTLTNGSVVTNGKTVTMGSFTSTNSNSRTFDMSGSTVTSAGSWNVSSTMTLVVNTSSSLISTQGFTWAGGGLTYNDVTWQQTQVTVTGANTFRNLNITGTQGGFYTLSANQTGTGTLTITGPDAVTRKQILSDTYGTARTLSFAAVSLTDVDFMDITGAGSAAPFSGTRLNNCKGNSGITFTAGATKYWVGNTANWRTANWALTSGGSGALNNYPLAQDSVIFDANSFSANGQTVTMDTPPYYYQIPAVDFSAISRTGITWAFSAGLNYYFHGDVKLESHMTVSGNNLNWIFAGRSLTQVMTTAGVGTDANLNFQAISGTFKLAGALTTGASKGCSLVYGTLDLDGNNLTIGTFGTDNSNSREIKSTSAGGKISTLSTSAGTVFNATTGTNLTVTRNSWTLEIGGNTTNARIFAGGGKTWPSPTFTNTTSGGELDFTGSNTFKRLAVSVPPQSLKFTAGTTTTIEDDAGFPSGSAGSLVTIGSLTGSNHTLTKSGGGFISSNFLAISRSTATPANTWYAGQNSTDGGNNSGWIFAFSPYGTLYGGLNLLAIVTAANSSSIAFTGGIDATYDEYLIKVTNLLPATDATDLYLRVSEDGGSTFKAGAGDYGHTRYSNADGGAVGNAGTNSDSKIVIASSLSSSKGFRGDIRFSAPAGTTLTKFFEWDITNSPSGSTINRSSGGGRYQLDTNAINAIQFTMSSGNISSGTFALYGFRKS